MNRPVVIAALLMSMLLQAVSLGGHWVGAANPADALDAVLHWAGLSHHHEHHEHRLADAAVHDDSDFDAFAVELASASAALQHGYHQDHSADSNHHMGQDACVGAMGPIPCGLGGTPVAVRSPHPGVRPEAEPPDPDLAGPRRPPKHLA